MFTIAITNAMVLCNKQWPVLLCLSRCAHSNAKCRVCTRGSISPLKVVQCLLRATSPWACGFYPRAFLSVCNIERFYFSTGRNVVEYLMTFYSVVVLAAISDRLNSGKHFLRNSRFAGEQPLLAQSHMHHRTPYPYCHGISLRPKVIQSFPARPSCG